MRLYRIRTTEGPTPAIEVDGSLFAAIGPIGLTGAGAADFEPDFRRPLGPLANARLLAPVIPGKIVAIGANYLDHIRESGMEPPPAPLIFAKFPSSIAGPGEDISVDTSLTKRVDWEVELAVVIGRRMKDVPRNRVFDYVVGYTAANDLSARDVQFGDGQWVRGKSFDGFCPIGPAIVSQDEIGNPQALQLRTEVNGETVQLSNTSEMLFPIDELLAYCSRCFTLEAGDLLLTGTPWGCGEFMQPRRSLSHGDRVTVSIENIGALTNTIVDRPVVVAEAAE
jgi:5-carboxymethyl-2-hydroxymuconate isomerase